MCKDLLKRKPAILKNKIYFILTKFMPNTTKVLNLFSPMNWSQFNRL